MKIIWPEHAYRGLEWTGLLQNMGSLGLHRMGGLGSMAKFQGLGLEKFYCSSPVYVTVAVLCL